MGLENVLNYDTRFKRDRISERKWKQYKNSSVDKNISAKWRL